MYKTETYILNAIEAVVKEQTTETLERLAVVLNLARQNNTVTGDLQRLTRDAIESQNACNPRPISLLLHYAIVAVMENGGNPAFENSSLVRVYLNTLLNIMGYRELPQYREDVTLYSRDIDSLEASVKVSA